MSRFIETAAHELDVRFTCGVHPDNQIVDYGLTPYYAIHSLVKSHGDKWETEGKPTGEFELNGERWATAMDYYESGLDPWEHEEFELQTVYEYKFYFTSKASPKYSALRADKDQRVKGGTITIRPRWPDLTSDGTPVSVPDYGKPYIDVQIQASNIPHRQYLTLVKQVMGSFGIDSRYFDNPHPDSHIDDLARYVRLERGESGPLFAPDGPIARSNTLIQGDRTGYRKHVEDNTKLPGYYVTAVIEDTKAPELIKGHSLGKELKHYYPEEPDEYEPNEAPYHPKFEVSYQASRTDETLRWHELDDAIRELDETIINCLDWAGLGTTADSENFVTFDPFWNVRNTTKSRKTVSCPLPEIESQQEYRIMQMWGDATPAARKVTKLLMTDGGEVSPQKAADKTGYSYRTVRDVINRYEEVFKHSYGRVEFQSKKVQQELLKRVRAAGENFHQEIGAAVLDLADAADERAQQAWSKIRRKYDITEQDSKDCRKLLKVGYKPTDRKEAKEILRELHTQYTQHIENTTKGIHVKMTFADGTIERFRDMSKAFRKGDLRYKQERQHNEKARRGFDWDAYVEAGCPKDWEPG